MGLFSKNDKSTSSALPLSGRSIRCSIRYYLCMLYTTIAIKMSSMIWGHFFWINKIDTVDCIVLYCSALRCVVFHSFKCWTINSSRSTPCSQFSLDTHFMVRRGNRWVCATDGNYTRRNPRFGHATALSPLESHREYCRWRWMGWEYCRWRWLL